MRRSEQFQQPVPAELAWLPEGGAISLNEHGYHWRIEIGNSSFGNGSFPSLAHALYDMHDLYARYFQAVPAA